VLDGAAIPTSDDLTQGTFTMAGRVLGAAMLPSDALAQLAAHEGEELGFWFLLDKERAVYAYLSLRMQFPVRKVLPFARRVDCDDIAAIVVSDEEHATGSVLRIHDGAMSGDEVRGWTRSLDQWLAQARKETQAP
jgi:hypothetical protein